MRGVLQCLVVNHHRLILIGTSQINGRDHVNSWCIARVSRHLISIPLTGWPSSGRWLARCFIKRYQSRQFSDLLDQFYPVERRVQFNCPRQSLALRRSAGLVLNVNGYDLVWLRRNLVGDWCSINQFVTCWGSWSNRYGLIGFPRHSVGMDELFMVIIIDVTNFDRLRISRVRNDHRLITHVSRNRLLRYNFRSRRVPLYFLWCKGSPRASRPVTVFNYFNRDFIHLGSAS